MHLRQLARVGLPRLALKELDECSAGIDSAACQGMYVLALVVVEAPRRGRIRHGRRERGLVLVEPRKQSGRRVKRARPACAWRAARRRQREYAGGRAG